MTDDPKNLITKEPFHLRLHRLREERRLTQSEVAAACNVKASSYSNWEQGRSLPSLDRLPILAEIFRTSIDYLLGLKTFAPDTEKLLSQLRRLDDADLKALTQIVGSISRHQTKHKDC
ncbi:Helix-turn-helix domain-containing protein [Selenomonas sp. GACV-9]|uniref:helix-turn-helix domain-containing protein n=1 Tax=Selenomonas sp. GACV-9 TaxID=3158782 RepID=UPI0008EF3B3C|nr:Helix-turn-helix domain-containing protein [Selenomonas ruminantium]